MFLGPTHLDPAKYHGAAVYAADALNKYLLPALAALIAPALTALTKMIMDRSHGRRSDEVVQRISKLGEYIHGLPELPPEELSGPTPRQALIAEMRTAILELSALQAKKRLTVGAMSATLSTRVRSAFLLYRPRGIAGYSLQCLFWAYSVLYVFALMALLSPSSPTSAAKISRGELAFDIAANLVLAMVASVPAIVLHYFAARLRRKQTAGALQATVITTVAASELQKVSV